MLTRQLITAALGAAALLAGLWIGCKRDTTISTAMTQPTSYTRPSAKDEADEERQKIIAGLEPIPNLGSPTPQKMPDGETWSRFPNGMLILDYKPSDGAQPQVGQTVHVKYEGRFPSDKEGKPGKVFDQSDDYTFRLGEKGVIKGFNLGVATMKVKGQRKVWLPADLAYGAHGSGVVIRGQEDKAIGPDQPLVFDLTLLKITGDPIELPTTQADTQADTQAAKKFDVKAGPEAPATQK